MITEIIRLRMPFKRGIIFREKEVPFLFKIMTLEMTCDLLGVDWGDIFSKQNSESDIYSSLIYCGYLAACKELYKKPKYTEIQAIFWSEYMSAGTRKEVLAEITKLLGYIKEVGEKKVEGEKKN
jgi:hypothetical protein